MGESDDDQQAEHDLMNPEHHLGCSTCRSGLPLSSSSTKMDGFHDDLERTLRVIRAWRLDPLAVKAAVVQSNSLHQIPATTSAATRSTPPPSFTAISGSTVRRLRDCVDMLSAVLEVSENFEASKEYHTILKKRLPSRKKGVVGSELVPPPPFTANMLPAKNVKMKTKSWKASLASCFRGIATCYVSCMLKVEGSGVDLTGLVGGGHVIAPRFQIHEPREAKSPYNTKTLHSIEEKLAHV